MADKIERKANDWYLSQFKTFEEKLNGHSESFLHDIRKNALSQLETMDFPTQRDEEWKYTNVSPILKNDFIPALASKSVVGDVDINKYLLGGFEYHLLVFVNGRFNEELSDIGELPNGCYVNSLAKAVTEKPELVEQHIGKLSSIDNAFNALNTTYIYDGLFVHVPDGKIIEKPIQVLNLSGSEDEAVMTNPRNVIAVGKNAQVSIIANYRGLFNSTYFNNVVNEISVDRDAVVDLYKIQHENDNAYHINKTVIDQKETSVFSHYAMSFGGGLVRNDLQSKLDGENIETNYWGLYLANDSKHIDNHTFVDHAKPNCVSNELYKGILDDKSRGVFSGKILVRQDAQQTNAYQSNKTVLLSDDATIDTKPQLEIYADDVKCSHGATVGHLDDEAHFYIVSRGISEEFAKSMLIRAFAYDVIEKVKIEPLREQLSHMIFEQLHRVEV